MDQTERKRVVGYLTEESLQRQWQDLKERYGAGDSALVNLLLTHEVRRIEGGNSKEQKLDDILSQLQHLASKVDMALYVAWAAFVKSGGMVARIDVEDVRTLRDSVQELIKADTDE